MTEIGGSNLSLFLFAEVYGSGWYCSDAALCFALSMLSGPFRIEMSRAGSGLGVLDVCLDQKLKVLLMCWNLKFLFIRSVIWRCYCLRGCESTEEISHSTFYYM